jgi:inosine-uridine nucleoside N-ribohydrolase
MFLNPNRLTQYLGYVFVLLVSAVLLACGGSSDSSSSTAMRSSCVLIDNDYDIDDMMAIPMVIGNKYVAAIIQSEGYTLPEQSAPAIDQLVNNIADQPNQRKIPIIVGAKQPRVDTSQWPWLSFFRSMMNQSNALLSSIPTPWSTDIDYTQKVVNSVANCTNVSVLIIGTYTSFINYSPLIKNKIDKVVIMGQAIGDNSQTAGRESFNCLFDLSACQQAMIQLQDLNTYFVDIPRVVGGVCRDTLTPSPNCYNPSYEMVAGQNGVGGLLNTGLTGRLKQALTNSIDCSSKYTAGMPAIPSVPESACTALSTWSPINVAAGPGGEMLMWDETASIFLLHPELFALYYPADRSLGGKHYQPIKINDSFADTAQMLRDVWTQDTNRATTFYQ